jgi:hypothetical protein
MPKFKEAHMNINRMKLFDKKRLTFGTEKQRLHGVDKDKEAFENYLRRNIYQSRNLW